MSHQVPTYNWPDNRKGAVNFGKEFVVTGRDDKRIDFNVDPPEQVTLWVVSSGKRPLLKLDLDDGITINNDGNIEVDNFVIKEVGVVYYDCRVDYDDGDAIYIFKGSTCFEKNISNYVL